MIAPPTYVLFPSVDPFEEEELSTFIRLAFLETGVDHTSVLSPIAHKHSLDLCVTSAPVPTMSFDLIFRSDTGITSKPSSG